MLNYANLNDMEFEALCQDVMGRMLGVPLRRFAPGKDGGVDLTDDAAQLNIVVQVKHYMASTTSGLIRVLKNELSKVAQLQPGQYYICCSKPLSPASIKGLYEHFQEYMGSSGNIVTLTEIDDFLKKPENKDILKKHFKLWLDDTGILNELYNDEIFVDCEVLLDDVKSRQHRFVQTAAFDRALDILEQGRTLCIIGDPGVGKSITSQMLVLHYAALGYRVRYTTEVTDLKSLKAALQHDKDSKEIILLDDCFGQAYFEMKSSQSKELVYLIRYVRHHPNKLLILNSRITIFREAWARQRILHESLEQNELQVHTLDMNEISDVEKAKILYNHLAFSGIPKEYFQNIRQNLRYRRIVFHPNYNPRIIEFVCSPSQYKTVSAGQFYKLVFRHLDNPQQIWADEYEDRLQPADRILLQTIYSLTNTTVSADLVYQCFNRRLADIPDIDRTVDQYSRSLERLNKNIIKQMDDNGTLVLSMLNPSVNDYLDNKLQPGSAEYEALVRSICCEQQLVHLLPWDQRLPYAVELLQSGRINSFLFKVPRHRTRFIARCILAAGLHMQQYCEELYTMLAAPRGLDLWYSLDRFDRRRIISRLEDPAFWDYYQLKPFFRQSDHLDNFLSQFRLEELTRVICAMEPHYQSSEDADYFYPLAEHAMLLEISALCSAVADDYVDSYLFSDALSESEMISDFEAHVWDKVTHTLYNALCDLPERLEHLDAIQFLDEIEISGVEEVVENFFADKEADDEADDDDLDDDKEEEIPFRIDPVDAVFQR